MRAGFLQLHHHLDTSLEHELVLFFMAQLPQSTLRYLYYDVLKVQVRISVP
jgi:ubiquinone biosynthesis protein Coq4